ncbi:MAG TPA: DUF4199 domain-containing protein [Flavisolibacter sp.]|jgi:hypothetical protein|nr:DUF4199 domain-containing protein [Flavisolibacter sp.]
MEETKTTSHIKAGLMISAVIIVLSLVLSVLGAGGTIGRGFHAFLIIGAGLVYFINRYAKDNNFNKSFGELFTYGFKTTSIFTLVFILFVIAFSIMDPDTKKQFLDLTRTELERKNMTDSEIDTYMSFLDKYYLIVMAGGTLLSYIVIGAIGSLLGAAITKKNPPNPMDQFNS